MTWGVLLNQASPAKVYTLTVNGVDILPRVPLDLAPVTWTDEASGGVGEMTFTVEHLGSWATRPALPRGAEVRFKRLDESSATFGGTLLDVVYSRGVTGHFAEVTVADHNWWFDNRAVPRFTSKTDIAGRNRRMTNDRNIVYALIDRRMPPLRATWSTIDSTNTDMALVKTEGMMAREVMETICDLAQTASSPYPRRFYADAERRVHYYMNNEGVAAPYHAGVDVLVEDLTVERDSTDVKHHVYIRGKNAKGSGWVYNKGSDFALGAVSTFLDRPNSDTVGDRNRRGRAFLRRQEEVVSGSFKVQGTTGWRAGQLLTITDAQLGLSSKTYEIRRVSGELHPGSHTVHTIEFGAPKRWLTRDLKRRDIL